MNRRLALVILAALVPLAACDKGGPTVSATNASQEEVSEKVAAASGGGEAAMVRPGRWEGTLTMHEIDMPGMPPQVRERMKASLLSSKSFVSCITPEDVKAKKAFFTGDGKDKSCTYDRFNMGGGKIDAVMRCAHDGGARMAMSMNGRYSPDSYDMNVASRSEGGPQGSAMSMKMTVAAKRVGECRGSKDES